MSTIGELLDGHRTHDLLPSPVADVDLNNWGLHVLLWFTLIILISPIVLAFSYSTQTQIQVYQIIRIWPGTNLIENYWILLTEYNFALYMRNSLIMTLIIIAGKLTFSLMAATAIVYYDFKYSRYVFYIILFTLLLPIPVRIVPLYHMMVDLGWISSFAGLTAPYIASATAIFLLRQRFRAIPASILEQAKVDGIGPIKFMVFVLIPMSKGMIVGVTVIMFISMWNKYLWPLIVVEDQSMIVAQVGLRRIQGVASEGLTHWELVMAGAMLALIPPLIIMILGHRHLLHTFGVEQR